MIELGRTHRSILFNGDGQKLYDAIASDIQHTLIFDPPWDIMSRFKMRDSENILAFCDGQRSGDVINLFGAPTWVFGWDCVSSWFTQNRPLKRMKLCFWYGDISKYKQKGCLYGEQDRKPRLITNSRGSYMFEPDPGGKMLSDLFVEPITKLHAGDGHHHSKPIDWITALIGNTLRDGDVVIDPFAGSGVTNDAAGRLGVNWIGAELDPDVAGRIILSSKSNRLPAVRRSEQMSLWV